MPQVRLPLQAPPFYGSYLCDIYIGPIQTGAWDQRMDGSWIAEGWWALAIGVAILLVYAVLLYLLVRSEFGVSE